MNNTIELNGRTYRVDVEDDQDMGAPWEEQDGHGIVSDWTTRNKRPGELILNSDRSSKRFYDFAATMKKAKVEGWGLSDGPMIALGLKLGRIPTKGEIAAAAVMADFEYLRGWCNDQWHWVGVVVTDITDDPDARTDYTFALWGLQSDDEDYQEQVALELAEEAYRQYAAANRFADAMSNAL